MNNTSSIAVICTPDHNKNIPHNAVDSIIAQTIKPEQLIIVYDRSSADTITALRLRIEKAMLDSQLICVEHDPDTTLIAARNNGLDCMSDCRYVHFINTDIKFPEDFYAKAVQGTMARSDCVATMPTKVTFTNDSKAGINSKNLMANPWLWLMRAKIEIASAVLLRSSAVEKAGKFNPMLLVGADADFFARISNQGEWRAIPDCVASQSLSQTKTDSRAQFPDYYRRWALVYENLLDTYGARNRISRKTYKPILANAWLAAGKELLSHQRIDEAHDCFTRSLSWRLFNRSFKYLMQIYRLKRNAHLSKASDS